MANSRISDLSEKLVLLSDGASINTDDDALLLLARATSHNETIKYKNFKSSLVDHCVFVTGAQSIGGVKTYTDNAIFEADLDVEGNLNVKGDIFNLKFEAGVDASTLPAYDGATSYTEGQQVAHNAKAWQKVGANQSEPAAGADWTDITLGNADEYLTQLDSNLETKGNLVVDGTSKLTGALSTDGSITLLDGNKLKTLAADLIFGEGTTVKIGNSGGLEVDANKDVNVGRDLTVENDLKVKGALQLDNDVTVGGIIATGEAIFHKSVSIYENLTVRGDILNVNFQTGTDDPSGLAPYNANVAYTDGAKVSFNGKAWEKVGDQDESGGVDAHSEPSASNTTEWTDITLTDDNFKTNFESDLAVEGDATIEKTLGVTGATTLAGAAATTLAVTESVTIGTTLGVTGVTTLVNATVGGTLGVTGDTTLVNATVGGTLGATGDTTLVNATVGGTLGATGDTTLVNATVGGTLGVSGVTTLGAVSATEQLNANGGIAVDTNKFTVEDTTGNTAIAGTLGVTELTTLGALTTTGEVEASSLKVTNAAELSGGLTVGGVSVFNEDVTILKDLHVKGDIFNVKFEVGVDPTGLTPYSTPEDYVLGDLVSFPESAVSKAWEKVGSNQEGVGAGTPTPHSEPSAANTAEWKDVTLKDSATNTTGLDSKLVVEGDATLKKTLGVTGSVTIGTTLGVTGDTTLVNATVGGTLGATGDTTLVNAAVGGTLGVTGVTTLVNATVGGTLGVTGDTTLVNATVGGTLGATGDTTLVNATVGGTLGATGDTTLVNATVGGTLEVSGVTTLGAVSATEQLNANGGIAVATDKFTVDENGNVTSKGNVEVTGTLSCANIVEATPTLPMLNEMIGGVTVSVPEFPHSIGTVGDIKGDANYIYVCSQTSDGTDVTKVAWKRLLLSSW